MADELVIASTPQPSRADALKNRALLLETARRLFDEQGADAVSMSSIAEAAGVGKGTLYRHFQNKSELCEALLDSEQRDLQERAFAHFRAHPDARANLHWFVAEVAAFVDRNIALIGMSLGSEVPSLQHPAHLWWRQTIRGLLGQLSLTDDLDYLADTFYVLLDGRTIRFQRYTLGYPLTRILDGLDTLVTRLAT